MGLLGPVLYWLMYHHLPSKDKQIQDFITEQHRLIKELRAEQETKVMAAVNAFREEAREGRVDRERHMGRLIEVIREEVTRLVRKDDGK